MSNLPEAAIDCKFGHRFSPQFCCCLFSFSNTTTHSRFVTSLLVSSQLSLLHPKNFPCQSLTTGETFKIFASSMVPIAGDDGHVMATTTDTAAPTQPQATISQLAMTLGIFAALAVIGIICYIIASCKNRAYLARVARQSPSNMKARIIARYSSQSQTPSPGVVTHDMDGQTQPSLSTEYIALPKKSKNPEMRSIADMDLESGMGTRLTVSDSLTLPELVKTTKRARLYTLKKPRAVRPRDLGFLKPSTPPTIVTSQRLSIPETYDIPILGTVGSHHPSDIVPQSLSIPEASSVDGLITTQYTSIIEPSQCLSVPEISRATVTGSTSSNHPSTIVPPESTTGPKTVQISFAESMAKQCLPIPKTAISVSTGSVSTNHPSTIIPSGSTTGPKTVQMTCVKFMAKQKATPNAASESDTIPRASSITNTIAFPKEPIIVSEALTSPEASKIARPARAYGFPSGTFIKEIITSSEPTKSGPPESQQRSVSAQIAQILRIPEAIRKDHSMRRKVHDLERAQLDGGRSVYSSYMSRDSDMTLEETAKERAEIDEARSELERIVRRGFPSNDYRGFNVSH